jgi:hypothetical protein
MDDSEDTLRNSKRHWILPSEVPDISTAEPQYIRQVNLKFSFPFLYTGSALLSPEGKMYAKGIFEVAGRCLGGGVLASRDLEWLAKGSVGEKPGDYTPTRGLFGPSKEPQSALPSEWIAFEYGLLLRGPYGSPLVSSWDHVLTVSQVRKQGNDRHIRIDGYFGAENTTIFAQANQHAIKDLLIIVELTGVPVYR